MFVISYILNILDNFNWKRYIFWLHMWTFLTESAIVIFLCSRRPWGWPCRDRNMDDTRRKVTNGCCWLCSCWITCCLVMLSSYVFRYFTNDSEMVPVASVITGIPVVFTLHIHSFSVVKTFRFDTFLSPDILVSINIFLFHYHVSYYYWLLLLLLILLLLITFMQLRTWKKPRF